MSLYMKSGLLDSTIDYTQHAAADVFTVTLAVGVLLPDAMSCQRITHDLVIMILNSELSFSFTGCQLWLETPV